MEFSLHDRVVWDSGFGYEIGYFLGNGHINTILIDIMTGKFIGKSCFPKTETYMYSDELIDKLIEKYGYEKRFSNVF